MKIKHLMVLLMITACTAAAFAGGGQQGTAPASTVKPGETAGFEEFPLGDDHELGPLNVAGVYFQPVDMLPANMGLSAAQSDVHLEADISALENNLGYGVGDFVPNLTVRYEISQANGWKAEGTFMPMNASDGPHYGANVKLNGIGDYRIRFLITNPEAQGYVLHVDKTTGVPGRFWTAPLVAEWDVTYPGPAW
ncbi:amino acid ABC transporter substrate-binding protein [Spirochaetia bacterium]|nr:amino acid ABC transporter substrate-binding protein [Spirochaetia bacterium]